MVHHALLRRLVVAGTDDLGVGQYLGASRQTVVAVVIRGRTPDTAY